MVDQGINTDAPPVITEEVLSGPAPVTNTASSVQEVWPMPQSAQPHPDYGFDRPNPYVEEGK